MGSPGAADGGAELDDGGGTTGAILPSRSMRDVRSAYSIADGYLPEKIVVDAQ
jgi:hypothetical protein